MRCAFADQLLKRDNIDQSESSACRTSVRYPPTADIPRVGRRIASGRALQARRIRRQARYVALGSAGRTTELAQPDDDYETLAAAELAAARAAVNLADRTRRLNQAAVYAALGEQRRLGRAS